MQPKLSWNWKGPYTFIQKISDHINEIFQGSFRKILSGHTSAGNNLALIYTCTLKNEIMNDYKKYLQFCYNYSVDFFSIYNYLKFIFTDVSGQQTLYQGVPIQTTVVTPVLGGVDLVECTFLNTSSCNKKLRGETTVNKME